jgi:hypothetical protein
VQATPDALGQPNYVAFSGKSFQNSIVIESSFYTMRLDPRTLIESAVLVALLSTLITTLVWRARRTRSGFGYWTLGNLAAALCLKLLGLRGIAPDWISIVVANGLSLTAMIFFLQGIRRFRGLRLRWAYEGLAAGATTAAIVFFRYGIDSINARICIVGVVLGGFGLISGIALLRNYPGQRTLGMAVTGLVFLLGGFGNFWHAAYASYAPVKDLFDPYGVNIIFLAGASLMVVGWSFGFVLMNGERLAMDSHASGAATPRAGGNVSNGAATVGVAIPESEVREQLRRIVCSDLFRKSPRMERFLTVAVDRTLQGQPDGLKEYTLGRDVFDRTEDYDPRLDSIVRVEAQRLRRKLRQYYESHGSGDAVLVEFNPGNYVPVFKYRNRPESNG